ncbi:uncharacterized protein PV09_08024 [Verruconis gallopava]|uniref:SAC domain-containing protein n=1 Tax=Verruconis gallopava TaxID=253628 RepID=A0A0D2AN31_9PEZI|nr:uncharacterized protein PV09_08024 [Verruconis gallopava]KIW00504.1 hypothetical protein PV09_08024 [Verruconis gallopava]
MDSRGAQRGGEADAANVAERQRKEQQIDESTSDDMAEHAGIGKVQDFPINDYSFENAQNKVGSDQGSFQNEGDDEEPPEPKSFQRSSSPGVMQRNKNAAYEKVGEDGVNNMHRFTLYETSTRFYLVGQDMMEKQFRILKIDRTAPPGHLNIFEDDIVYDRREINQLLNAIEEGNRNAGGMKLKLSTWGLLGFIRFTEAYYMLLITKRTHVAMVGGHYIYQIEATDMIPLTTGSTSRFQQNRNAEEARYLSILGTLDLTKYFYFSYSYNITRTLQWNIINERNAINEGRRRGRTNYNDMFVWNHYLLQPATKVLRNVYDWCVPIIHGYIEQASLDVFGRRVYMSVIARRSRFFAGARFLKRGSNDVGFVANDVETEQIVSTKLTTSFHAPGPGLYTSPNYTSYVQHRGSIPLYWSQDNTGVTPKPDIDINLIDPFYTPAALHFNNLFERYGSPIFVLNLIKQRERTPRESKLGVEFQRAVDFLNQSLPSEHKIRYKAFDMSRAAKTRGQDVIGTLESIAETILQTTGFFHNGPPDSEYTSVQNGVARTNCIDCLDRTNAAQFVIGKRALGRQLQALGIIKGNTVEYDTDAVNIFTHMFHAHGDTIAIQYGGSHLVNTMSTYRKINEWKSQSRDMVESFKRYYHNSFLDSQRQEAYNLFLGNYIFAQGQPMLWDLATDYYLHHTDPRDWKRDAKRDYIHWYQPENLKPRVLPPVIGPPPDLRDKGVSYFDDYWLEYYRPLAISSFAKMFAWKIGSRPRYLPDGSFQTGTWDPSPFTPRKPPQQEPPDSPGKKVRKGVTILDPQSDDNVFYHKDSPAKQSLQANGLSEKGIHPSAEPPDKNRINQWTLNQHHHYSLNPFITAAEEKEYEEYVSHPQNIPLVTSLEEPDVNSQSQAHRTYLNYINSAANITSSRVHTAHSLSLDGTTGTGVISIADHLHKSTISLDGTSSIVPPELEIGISEEDLADYAEFLTVSENPLDVTEEDGGKKRYKAYRQWLRGKSLFKQSKVDPEARA